MKQETTRHKSGMTLIEAILVIFVLAVLASLLLPALARAKIRGGATCLGKLKIIGNGYQMWAEDDHNGQWPASESATNGGWKELLSKTNQGENCWTNYVFMSNYFRPGVLICPADERTAATNFATDFNNSHLSYFVGVSASPNNPQSILGGDRNLSPGARPELDYGYSPPNGKGNDVAIPISGPVSWSLKMHSAGNPAGAGNILLADGSVQVNTTTSNFNQAWLRNAPPTTNWPAGHVPASPSIRLVFP